MKNIRPTAKTTETSPDGREWVPTSFDNVLRELEHISGSCDGDDPIPLYRGHADYRWKLDCTLVRTLLFAEFSSEQYPRSVSFHTTVVDAMLEKFGRFWVPSREAFEKEANDNIDAWFELMKRFQQYAEEDSKPKGTFLIDWSTAQNIALYFATYIGRGVSRTLRTCHGAMWIWDPVPTGKVLQTKRLGEILSLMRDDAFRTAIRYSVPLIMHPEKQTRMLRALWQKPVYVSQMDYRWDLADVWSTMETNTSSVIFKKAILTESVLQDCVAYLQRKGIDENIIYPE